METPSQALVNERSQDRSIPFPKVLYTRHYQAERLWQHRVINQELVAELHRLVLRMDLSVRGPLVQTHPRTRYY